MLFTRLAAPFGGRDLAVGNPSVPSFSDLRGRVSVYGFVYKYACVYLCVCECMCVCMYDSFFSFLTHTDPTWDHVVPQTYTYTPWLALHGGMGTMD